MNEVSAFLAMTEILDHAGKTFPGSVRKEFRSLFHHCSASFPFRVFITRKTTSQSTESPCLTRSRILLQVLYSFKKLLYRAWQEAEERRLCKTIWRLEVDFAKDSSRVVLKITLSLCEVEDIVATKIKTSLEFTFLVLKSRKRAYEEVHRKEKLRVEA